MCCTMLSDSVCCVSLSSPSAVDVVVHAWCGVVVGSSPMTLTVPLQLCGFKHYRSFFRLVRDRPSLIKYPLHSGSWHFCYHLLCPRNLLTLFADIEVWREYSRAACH